MSLVKRSLVFSSTLALAWLGIVTPAAAQTPPVTIDIAAVNDFHGRILNKNGAAGSAALGCAVDAMRRANPNSVFVAAGDLIGGSTFESSVAQDKPTIEMLNHMGLKTSAVGNHEFDRGVDDFDKRVIPSAKWSYISANLFRGGKLAYSPYDTVVLGGVRVAFVGATTEDLASLTSSGDIEARDMTDSVNAVVKQLSDGDEANGEADAFIVLVHEGAESPDLQATSGTAYNKLIRGVDRKVSAILSGHTHQLYATQVNGIWVMQSEDYGKKLGRLTLSYDPDTKTTTVTKAWNQPLVDDKGAPTCTDLDPALVEMQKRAEDAARKLGQAPLGSIASDLLRASRGADRGNESTLGNLVADVHLWASKKSGAKVALMNPGGLREDLLFASSEGEGDGVVTMREASDVQPFANTVMVRDLTGAQLKKVLEQQWQVEGSSRPMLKLGISKGLHYTFDPAAPAGKRITSITLDGVPVKPSDVIRVAANSFLMAGKDGFTAFTEGTPAVDTGWVDLDTMVHYLKTNSPVGASNPVAADPVQRSFGVTYHTPADRVYAPGEEVSIDLSSLSFTNDEKKPATVSAKIGDRVIGTFTVDNTVTEKLDLTGQAKVRLRIPDDLARQMSSGSEVTSLVLSDDVNGELLSLRVKAGPQGPSASPTPSATGQPQPGDPPSRPSDQPSGPNTPQPSDPKRPLPKTGGSAGSGLILAGITFGASLAYLRRR